MNIFVLDSDAATSARMMCDKHVVKMIVESCQLLSTAHHVLDGTEVLIDSGKRKYKTFVCKKQNICKATMINHPCTIWVRETRDNYVWLWKHAYALCKEYTRRYNKVHVMEKMLLNHLYNFPKNIMKNKMTNFAQAMPDQYKNKNAVIAYREYYLNEKAGFAKWKATEIPVWFEKKNSLLDLDLVPSF
jgi:Pyrimidine dimer DNA glycosylase